MSEWNKIICGDSLEKLKELPDGVADCCITSPPYYGLRDYGTGKWVGGDPNCNHETAKMSTRFERTMTKTSAKQMTNVGSDVKQYIRVCPACGAVREDKQIGLEETPEEYINKLVSLFREVKRVLKDDGTLWVNIGDSYNGQKKGNTETNKHKGVVTDTFEKKLWNGAKEKDMIGIPWMLAFALRNDGWYLRQDIIWHKPNPMPESVKDRCTKSHEYIFLLSKQQHYYFDYEAIQEEATGYDGRKDTMNKGSQKYLAEYMPNQSGITMASRPHERWQYKNLAEKGQQTHTMHERRAEGKPDIIYPVRNKRDVWDVCVKPNHDAHFATFPEDLVRPCILAGSRKGGVVLDPFFGSGTTGRVAREYGRNYIGIELNPEYVEIAKHRAVEVQLSIFGMENDYV